MRTKVIAEAGQCGEGNPDIFAAMAVEAAAAGCWGFKVQLLRPETIATPDAPIYWTDRRGHSNQRQTFREAGLVPYEDWLPVVKTCLAHGIEFLGTPFDKEAVDALAGYGCRYVKVASGDITNLDLLVHIRDSGMRPILSTGGANVHEIIDALDALGRADVILLACSLEYPTPIRHAELGRIATLKERFPGFEVGYSDHTRGEATGGLAVAAGATWLEKHYTYGPNVLLGPRPGGAPDHDMALDPRAMARYVAQAESAEDMLGTGTLGVHEGEIAAVEGARRSLYYTSDLPAGHVVSEVDIVALRPTTAAAYAAQGTDLVIGRSLARDVKRYDPVIPGAARGTVA